MTLCDYCGKPATLREVGARVAQRADPPNAAEWIPAGDLCDACKVIAVNAVKDAVAKLIPKPSGKPGK